MTRNLRIRWAWRRAARVNLYERRWMAAILQRRVRLYDPPSPRDVSLTQIRVWFRFYLRGGEIDA